MGMLAYRRYGMSGIGNDSGGKSERSHIATCIWISAALGVGLGIVFGPVLAENTAPSIAVGIAISTAISVGVGTIIGIALDSKHRT